MRWDERTQVLAVTSTALLLSVLVWFNYSAVLPLIVDEWGLSGIRAGMVFAAFQAGYLVAIVPAGMLADRRSPRWVIAVGAIGTGVPSLGFALLADGFLTGSALRFLSGVGMAGVYVPGMRFLTDWYDESIRGRAIGVYTGMFALSSGLSFLLSSSVAEAADWRVAIGVTSIGAVIVGPAVLALTRDRPARRSAGFDWSLFRDRGYLSAVGVYAWHNWELFGAWNWMVAFLLSTAAVGAGSTVLAGTLAGVVMVLGGVGTAVGGWLSDSWGRSRVIVLALGTSGIVSLVLGGLGWLPLWALVVVLAVYGLALTADSAPVLTALTEVAPDESVGVALSVQSLGGFVTTAVSPVVFGAALDAAGFGLAFPTLAFGAAAGLVSLLVLERHR